MDKSGLEKNWLNRDHHSVLRMPQKTKRVEAKSAAKKSGHSKELSVLQIQRKLKKEGRSR